MGLLILAVRLCRSDELIVLDEFDAPGGCVIGWKAHKGLKLCPLLPLAGGASPVQDLNCDGAAATRCWLLPSDNTRPGSDGQRVWKLFKAQGLSPEEKTQGRLIEWTRESPHLNAFPPSSYSLVYEVKSPGSGPPYRVVPRAPPPPLERHRRHRR